MTTQERKNRIIARGEHSNHSHVVVGTDVQIERSIQGEILVTVGEEGAVLKHILESEWLKGNEVWTKEHLDIPLEKGQYKYVAQEEFDPFKKHIRRVID